MFELIAAILIFVGVCVPAGLVMDRLADGRWFWSKDRWTPPSQRQLEARLDGLKGRVDHQKVLARIDELERELEIGKYSPEAKELDRLMAEEEARERRDRQLTFDRIFGERRKESRLSIYKLKVEITRELGYNASGDYVSLETQAELAAAAGVLTAHEEMQRQEYIRTGHPDSTGLEMGRRGPIRRVVDKKTGEWSEIRSFGD